MSKTRFDQFSSRGLISGPFFLLSFSLLQIVVATSSNSFAADQPGLFRSDFKVAMREAEEKKLPLLIHFYADWCTPCQRMEREVFTNSTVKDLLGGHFIAVKINSDHHQELLARYGIQTLPSDVIVDSLTGRVLATKSGFQDRNGYLSYASQAEAQFLKSHPRELVAGTLISAGNTEPSGEASKTGETEPTAPKLIIGLNGFSPVALAKTRQWNKGSPKLAWDYRDVTYYFSTRDELVEFREHPEVYAPKLLGCDPVILWESDKAVAGDIRYGAFFDDELFLFKSEERRTQFKSNPEKYIRLQHALKVDQIEQTVIR